MRPSALLAEGVVTTLERAGASVRKPEPPVVPARHVSRCDSGFRSGPRNRGNPKQSFYIQVGLPRALSVDRERLPASLETPSG